MGWQRPSPAPWAPGWTTSRRCGRTSCCAPGVRNLAVPFRRYFKSFFSVTLHWRIKARQDLISPLPGSFMGFLVMGSRVEMTELDMMEHESSSLSSPPSFSLSLFPLPSCAEAALSITTLVEVTKVYLIFKWIKWHSLSNSHLYSQGQGVSIINFRRRENSWD